MWRKTPRSEPYGWPRRPGRISPLTRQSPGRFFAHLAVLVVVNAILVTVNLTSGSGDFWARWPLMGWGIGLAFHGLAVFVVGDRFAVTDEMVERELSKRPHG